MDQANLGNMSYYPRQYSAEDMQTMADINMSMMMGNAIDPSGAMDYINMNNKDSQRRRSYHQSQQYGGNRVDPRRSSLSMMEFGAGNDLAGYQFEPNPPAQPATQMQRPTNMIQRRLGRSGNSADDLALDTTMGHNYNPGATSTPYQLQHTHSLPLSFSAGADYMSNNLMLGLDYPSNGLNQENNGDITPMNMYSQSSFAPGMDTSSMPQNVSNSMRGPAQDPGGGIGGNPIEQDVMNKMPNLQMSDHMQNLQADLTKQSMPQQPTPLQSMTSAPPVNPLGGLPDMNATSGKHQNAGGEIVATNGGALVPADNAQSTIQKPVVPQYRNAYSASGFDMLGVLMRVATRPNAHINIGAVDMSCAFAVCDVTQHDLPIVYCSDIFERLTGYTKHEILGRNCRFLQAPDGKITAGVKRKYVDDQSVMRIKNIISQRQEMQISIINYRKGGQPFMNLLTMIPITWDSDEIKYYVGFQVDLVEQPTSITNKNPGNAATL